MTPNAQRVAMAALEGRDLTRYRFRFQLVSRTSPQWSPGYNTLDQATYWRNNEKRWRSDVGKIETFTDPQAAPWYLDSLDAVSQVEALAMRDGWAMAYYDQMNRVLNDALRNDPTTFGPNPFHYMTATAPQRVEAILKATNRWDPSL